jgi:hypothetical protein
MTILHLGVVDIPYASQESGASTTGDVAEILEAKYGVMGYFFERHGDEIAAALVDSMVGAIGNLAAGAPPVNNPFGDAESEIEQSFRKFLDDEEMNGQPGVPTRAALRGVNRRLKRGRGSPRPSFIDTGLYESSFTAWVD